MPGHHIIHEIKQHDQKYTRKGGESGVPASEVVCRIQSRQKVKTKRHGQRLREKLHRRRNQEQRQQQDTFLGDLTHFQCPDFSVPIAQPRLREQGTPCSHVGADATPEQSYWGNVLLPKMARRKFRNWIRPHAARKLRPAAEIAGSSRRSQPTSQPPPEW